MLALGLGLGFRVFRFFGVDFGVDILCFFYGLFFFRFFIGLG